MDHNADIVACLFRLLWISGRKMRGMQEWEGKNGQCPVKGKTEGPKLEQDRGQAVLCRVITHGGTGAIYHNTDYTVLCHLSMQQQNVPGT